jgi:hypothetical protein
MGTKLPTSHLQDPTEILRRLRLSKLLWPMIERRAESIDKRYPGFTNKVLDPLPKKEHKKFKEMVIY